MEALLPLRLTIRGIAVPNAEDITDQEKRLAVYRRTLAHYLYRRALIGETHVPPEIANGIEDARQNIRRIKETLRGWGIPVEDLPDDESTEKSTLTSHTTMHQKRVHSDDITITEDLNRLLQIILGLSFGGAIVAGGNMVMGIQNALILCLVVIVIGIFFLINSRVRILKWFVMGLIIGSVITGEIVIFNSGSRDLRPPVRISRIYLVLKSQSI